jgi:multisubunit Na+/H+ antiporter MnhC subunit
VRFVVVTLALLFVTGMIYLTVADFVQNGVTGLGVVGAVVVTIVSVGTVGSFLQPARRTNESSTTRRVQPPDGDEDGPDQA